MEIIINLLKFGLINFAFVLIISYIPIKKMVVSKFSANFTVQDHELLMKKSRQIGFVSLIISTSVFVITFHVFTEGIIDFFCNKLFCSKGDSILALVFVIALMGMCIIGSVVFGFLIAKGLIKREIKKYM